MARPKGRPPKQEDEKIMRVSIMNLKGSPDYAAWLEAIHRKTHIPKMEIVRLALAEWAKNHRHAKPPDI